MCRLHDWNVWKEKYSRALSLSPSLNVNRIIKIPNALCIFEQKSSYKYYLGFILLLFFCLFPKVVTSLTDSFSNTSTCVKTFDYSFEMSQVINHSVIVLLYIYNNKKSIIGFCIWKNFTAIQNTHTCDSVYLIHIYVCVCNRREKKNYVKNILSIIQYRKIKWD